MRLAERVTEMTGDGSDGWEVYYEARRRIAAGEKIANLTIGEHDIGTDRSILEAMHQSALAGNTGYTMGAGKPALRAAIAARVSERTGVPTRPENIVVTPGGQSALFSAHMVLLDPGARALYLDPHYATYPATLRATGATAVAVQARSRDNFQPQAEALDQAAAGARTLLINTPNNPTGVVYDATTLVGIADVARRHDLWVVSDEVYDTQVWQGAHQSLRSLPGMAERTVTIGSLSKSHSMTGSRLGWIVAPEAVVEAVTMLATNTTYGVPGFVQDAALFALKRGAAFETAIAAPFRRRRDLAIEILRGSNALRMIPSSGGMFFMLDIRATGLSGSDFAQRLLNERAIAVMPGESFGKSSAGHIRVAMTIEDSAFGAALRQLVDFAEVVAA